MSRIAARLWPVVVCLLALASLAAATALSKDDVIRMTRQGQSEQAILDALRDSHATFDLTADGIADLRQAGVSETVIDTMINAAPPEPVAGQTGTAQAAPGQDQPEQAAPEPPSEPESDYAVPPPVAYPVFPLYYPVYYPVYDPFFPFFGGVFFSFQFIHVSRFFTVFPCDRAVIVVNNSAFVHRTSLRGSNAAVFSTPRTLPRSGPGVPQVGPIARGNVGRPRAGPAPASRSPVQAPSRARRIDAPSSPRGTGGPRWSVAPRPAPRPRLQAPPSFAAPTFRRPPAMPAPRGGFAPRGGMRSFGAPRTMGGGRGHGGHR